MRFQLNVVAGGQVAREFLTVVMPQAADSPAEPGELSRLRQCGNPKTNAVPRQPVSSEPVATRELRQFKPLGQPESPGGYGPSSGRTSTSRRHGPGKRGNAVLTESAGAFADCAASFADVRRRRQRRLPRQPPADAPAQRNPPAQAALSASEAQPPYRNASVRSACSRTAQRSAFGNSRQWTSMYLSIHRGTS